MDHTIKQGDKLFKGPKYADSWWIYTGQGISFIIKKILIANP